MKTYLESKTVLQDKGEFVALAACFNTVDRVGDRIIPGAFSKTLELHRTSAKSAIPLLWDHKGGDPEYVIGAVDSSTMREVDAGLEVSGKIDLESDKGKEAWRAIRSGSMSLSFGFLTLKQRTASDGVNELLELDLLEVSVVSSPAHASTHFISLKSERGAEQQPSAKQHPSESEAIRAILQRNPEDLVREAQARKAVEAKVAAEARKAQVELVSFGTDA